MNARRRTDGARAWTTYLAIAALTLVLAACGPSADEEAARGRELARGGDAAGAAEAFTRALARRDDDALHLELARALAQAGRPQDALREYQLLLRHRPDDGALWLEFGRFSEGSQHDLRGAEAAYRRATELVPAHAEARLFHGLVLVRLADYEGAKAELQAALSLDDGKAAWRTTAENAIVEAHLLQRDAEKSAPGAR